MIEMQKIKIAGILGKDFGYLCACAYVYAVLYKRILQGLGKGVV